MNIIPHPPLHVTGSFEDNGSTDDVLRQEESVFYL